jgi:membrane protease YdiL (CAAX protease family)
VPRRTRRSPAIAMVRLTGGSVFAILYTRTNRSVLPITMRSALNLTRWCWFVILAAAQVISR